MRINTTFEDVQMMVKWFFDFSTGFRFSKISVECSVHMCSCPWLILFFPFLILFHKFDFTFTENLWMMNASFHNMLCESMEADLRILWWKHPYFFNMLRTCVGLSFYFWYAGRRSNIEYARPYWIQGVPFKANSFPNHFVCEII